MFLRLGGGVGVCIGLCGRFGFVRYGRCLCRFAEQRFELQRFLGFAETRDTRGRTIRLRPIRVTLSDVSADPFDSARTARYAQDDAETESNGSRMGLRLTDAPNL